MQKQLTIIISSLLFLLPLMFWTLTPNFFATPKQILLIIATLLAIFIWLFNSIRKGVITVSGSSLTYPLIVFILGLVISLATTTEATTEAIIGRGSLYLSSAVLALLVASNNSKRLIKSSLTALLASSSLLAVHSILQLTILHSLPTLPTYMNTRAFSLASSPLVALSLIVLGIVISISWATSTKSSTKRTLLLALTAVQTIAVVAYLSLMIDGRELVPTLLPLTASWSIALDSLKTIRNIFLGTGLSNFTPFYSLVKPLSLNSGIFWNILPSAASSELLQILTTAGLVLFLPLILLFTSFISSVKHLGTSELSSPLKAASITAIIIFILTPGSVVTIPLLFILLALSSHTTSSKLIPIRSSSARFLTTALVLSLIFTTLFFTGKVVLAESHLRRAQLGLADNNGQVVYEEHLKAIGLVPTLTNYHLSYSQINLTLAASLSQREELTEEQRTQVTQLLSQAVREARLATQLRPSLASTWSNLGFIYRNLINVAEGAENLALENYSSAVTLDPANPSLRVELGGIFYQLAGVIEDKEVANSYLIRAVEEFTTATRLKANYANAWYNLAKAYELGGNIELAYKAMQQTIASLEVDSPDIETATSELSALEAKLPAPKTPQSKEVEANTPAPTISEPDPLPSPIPGGPIEIPTEEVAPSAIPTPTPTPTPKPSAKSTQQ